MSAYDAIKSKVAGVCSTVATPATETVEAVPVAEETPAVEEKASVINAEAVSGLKDVFNAGKSFLKKAFAKTEAPASDSAEPSNIE